MVRIKGWWLLSLGVLMALGTPEANARGRAKRERLSTQQLRSAIKRVMGTVRMCAHRHGLVGRLRVRAVVRGKTGRIRSLRLTGIQLQSKERTCLRKAVLRARFPRFRRTSQTFVYPIVFRARTRPRRRSVRPPRLPSAELHRVFRRLYPKFRACFKGRRGKYKMRISITVRGSNGRVSRVRIARGNARGAPKACVKRVMRSARFRRFREPKKQISYSLRLAI